MRIGIDSPVNILDNMYTSTKKKVQEIVMDSYDDIDNYIPNDSFEYVQKNDKNNNEQDSNEGLSELIGNLIKIYNKM